MLVGIELVMRLQAQGATLDQYFETSGQDQQSFVDELRETATEGVRVDLALRAVAEAEAIEPSDEDLDELDEITR